MRDRHLTPLQLHICSRYRRPLQLQVQLYIPRPRRKLARNEICMPQSSPSGGPSQTSGSTIVTKLVTIGQVHLHRRLRSTTSTVLNKSYWQVRERVTMRRESRRQDGLAQRNLNSRDATTQRVIFLSSAEAAYDTSRQGVAETRVTRNRDGRSYGSDSENLGRRKVALSPEASI